MILRLNNKFYNEKAVKEALKDFKDICKGKILNNMMEIELDPKEEKEIKQLKEEFSNYVLGLMKNKGLV